MSVMIQARGLAKTYGNVPALAGVDLELNPGRIVGLLGENGCGKTTLLKVLAGVLSGYSGQAQIGGQEIGPDSKALVSFLPDTSFLPDAATLRYCLELYDDFFADFRAEKAQELIRYFGLDLDMKLKAMSKGMREKAQIALAMARDAKVYLLDEPISGVDPAAREVILQGITRDLPEDALVIISTHLIHDLEPILDSVVFMRYGKVLLSGDVDDLRAEHGKSVDQLFREVYQWVQN